MGQRLQVQISQHIPVNIHKVGAGQLNTANFWNSSKFQLNLNLKIYCKLYAIPLKYSVGDHFEKEETICKILSSNYIMIYWK